MDPDSLNLASDSVTPESLGAAGGVRCPVAEAWRNVARDGMPPCDGETVFVGINSAGYPVCFNEVTEWRSCFMNTAEESVPVMGDLIWWRVLDRPDTSGGAEANPCCGFPVGGPCPDCPDVAGAGSSQPLKDSPPSEA